MRVTVQFDVLAASTTEAVEEAVKRLDAPDVCIVTIGQDEDRSGGFYRGGAWRDAVRNWPNTTMAPEAPPT